MWRDLCDYYGDEGRYEDCMSTGLFLMRRMFRVNEASLLLNILDIFSANEKNAGNREQEKKIYRGLFYIAELYGRYSDAEIIRAYCEKEFTGNERWY